MLCAFYVNQMMVDFHACRWPRPELNADDVSLAEFFDAMNDEPLQPLLAVLQQSQQPAAAGAANGTVNGAASAQPGGSSQPLGSNCSNDGGEQCAATNGHAVAAAVDACSSGSGTSDGAVQRPPVLTFSHYLPYQVNGTNLNRCLTPHVAHIGGAS